MSTPAVGPFFARSRLTLLCDRGFEILRVMVDEDKNKVGEVSS
jgi:hypothetical protein